MSLPAGRINNSQQSQTSPVNQPNAGPSTASAADSVATSHLQQESKAPRRGNLEGAVTCHYKSCNKTLTSLQQLMQKCRCEHMFCKKHIFFTAHDCTYDYRGKQQEHLTSSLVDQKAPKTRQWHHSQGSDGNAS